VIESVAEAVALPVTVSWVAWWWEQWHQAAPQLHRAEWVPQQVWEEPWKIFWLLWLAALLLLLQAFSWVTLEPVCW